MAAQDGASSSTGSKPVSFSNCDVFINFRGDDTRNNFTSFLYRALKNKGMNPFLDSDKLWIGEAIGPTLQKAIDGSKISIPIISERYADSHWCLQELAQIVECHHSKNQIILPIFFDVEPSDVRKQAGTFEDAFLKHQEKYPQNVESWKKALTVVANLSGQVLDKTKDQADAVELVAERAKMKLIDRKRLAECEYLIDMNSRVNDLKSLLNIGSNDVQLVGISGFSGIGKTTLAKAVYNDIFSTFHKHCFLSDIKEQAAQIGGLVSLQKQFLKDVFKEESDISDRHQLKRLITERVSKEKFLLVLDDVDSKEQIDALAIGPNCIGPGSRVIITARDEHILNLAKVNRDKMYRPPLLDDAHSLQLFSCHAFTGIQPQKDYLDLSTAIVKVLGGLPLALEVIGSSLSSKNKPIWEEMLERLQKVPNSDVMGRLRISYDGLGHQEQQMFLDTACFFIGMKKDIACYIWKSCGFFPQTGLDVLCAKSLITINEDDELRMHDVLKDLGREIIRQESTEPEKRSRIWSKEEALNVLVNGKGTSKCVGLSTEVEHRLKSEGLDAMTELRLLRLDCAEILGKCRNSFSELRWLSWRNCLTNSSSKLRRLSWKGRHGLFALTKFCPIKLVVLDLSKSEMTEKWMGWNYIKMAVNLKVLIADHCRNLRSTPDFSGNRLLEVLSFKYCENLISVHTSIGYLKNLVTLDMRCCWTLVDLPIKGCELAFLKTLNLFGCTSLKNLPDFPPSLTTLEFINCSSPQNIKFGYPSSLTNLSITSCNSVQCISGLPSSLRSLQVYGCASLVKLSSASEEEGLGNLKTLHIKLCQSLEEIEGVDDKLESLEELDILKCDALKNLPKLRCSKNLLRLTIRETNILSNFEGEGMDSLEELTIEGCYSLKKIPYLRDSKRLRRLVIDGCPELMKIEQLESYEESLEILVISQVPSLEASPSMYISALKNLTRLSISYCRLMESFFCFSNLKELRELSIDKCNELPKSLRLYGLESLQELRITNCDNLIEICGVESLKSLKTLWIFECCSLEKLPDLSNLKEVCVQGCKNIPDLIHR